MLNYIPVDAGSAAGSLSHFPASGLAATCFGHPFPFGASLVNVTSAGNLQS